MAILLPALLRFGRGSVWVALVLLAVLRLGLLIRRLQRLEFHERSHRRSVRPGTKLFEPPPIFGRKRARFVDELRRVVAFAWLPFAGVAMVGFPMSQRLRGAIALPLGYSSVALRIV